MYIIQVLPARMWKFRSPTKKIKRGGGDPKWPEKERMFSSALKKGKDVFVRSVVLWLRKVGILIPLNQETPLHWHNRTLIPS